MDDFVKQREQFVEIQTTWEDRRKEAVSKCDLERQKLQAKLDAVNATEAAYVKKCDVTIASMTQTIAALVDLENDEPAPEVEVVNDGDN